jgi:hypothetical protein
MSPENLKLHIVNDLMKKQKLTENDATYLADTLLDGHKKVLDGQYAILYKGYNENRNKEIAYYVRKDNKWQIDKGLKNKINTDDSSILCNLQEKCINVPSKIDDKCESIQVDELTIQTNLLNDVIDEFDEKYRVSKEEFERNMLENFERLKNVIYKLTTIETTNMLKYNNKQYELGSNVNDEIEHVPISPNMKILNIILNQGDFIKKQHDIVRFVNAYARQAIITNFDTDFDNEVNSINGENYFWLYCIKTGIKLLPKFKYDLAVAFITNPELYKTVLEQIKSKIGTQSDDGDWWCDKHSGWPICPVDFDIEEGFDEGFKVTSRSILEDDAGNKIISEPNKSIKYDTIESRIISNVVNAVSIAMGINIETQKEFIINSVLTTLKDAVPEDEYKQLIKKRTDAGKNVISYKDYYNTGLLYNTLGMFLIAVQTAIPSVKTRKTHPGCVRSFSGFPFEGVGDDSSLTYLACIAYDIRESGEPWNVLQRKKKEFIMSSIKTAISEGLLNIPEVTRKFEEKTIYLLTNGSEEIPEEHSITKWSNFLPPLVNFNIKHLSDVSSEFKSSLITDLRTGSHNQIEKLLVIDSKIIQFSLAIQERIQEIVKRKQMLLNNANNEPYLENACCESNDGETTINYFTSKDERIIQYNDIVKRLTNILQDITSYSKGSLFYSDVNTKNKYPQVANGFDEKTIYLAFIYFCKFKSLLPIPEDLVPLCTDKPDIALFERGESIDIIIQKLKENGKNYKKETFLHLLQLIGRKNIVDVNFNEIVVSSITRLLGRLESIRHDRDELVEPHLVKLITGSLNTYDVASREPSKETRELKNYLSKNIEEMKDDIIDFITKNKSSKVNGRTLNEVRRTIGNFSLWNTDLSTRKDENKISNDKMYKIVNFYKTFIQNIVLNFPNIILNSVDYSKTKIQSYLGLSLNHASKIQTFIGEYYAGLKPFYGENVIYNILTQIQKTSHNVVKLSQDTPCFTSMRFGDEELQPVIDERTSRLLFEFYLLSIFINYIDLTDDSEILVVEPTKKIEVQDVFTVEFLDSVETRMDPIYNTRDIQDEQILSGNKMLLKQKMVDLLITYLKMFKEHKNDIDITYEEIQDAIFKLKEGEKNMITDRLQKLTDEERNVDTMFKINKLGTWGKGKQKGLTSYDKDMFEEERDFRDNMDRIEKQLRSKHNNINDDTLNDLREDVMEQGRIDNEIDTENNDISYLDDDYLDGNTDGYDNHEGEESEYYDS